MVVLIVKLQKLMDQVFIESDDISKPGDIVKVKILQGFDYDVVGERVDVD